MFHIFSATLKHTIKTKTILPDKTGEKNHVLSYLAISAQKYPKIVTQEEKKFQSIHNTIFQNYVVILTGFGRCCSHVYGHKKTFNQNKNCS